MARVETTIGTKHPIRIGWRDSFANQKGRKKIRTSLLFILHTLLRPFGASKILAEFTFPAWRMWSLSACHRVSYFRLPTKTPHPSLSFRLLLLLLPRSKPRCSLLLRRLLLLPSPRSSNELRLAILLEFLLYVGDTKIVKVCCVVVDFSLLLECQHNRYLNWIRSKSLARRLGCKLGVIYNGQQWQTVHLSCRKPINTNPNIAIRTSDSLTVRSLFFEQSNEVLNHRHLPTSMAQTKDIL